MKKASTIFFLLVAVVAISGSAQAQGRGRDRGGERRAQERGSYDRGKGSRANDRYSDPRNRNHDLRQRPRRPVRYVDRYQHRPVIIHHHVRPRYVYYRDYDVYFDYTRNVYIYLSHGRWIASASVPFKIRHLNPRYIRRFEVSYYDDDFPGYLERRGRPPHGRECHW